MADHISLTGQVGSFFFINKFFSYFVAFAVDDVHIGFIPEVYSTLHWFATSWCDVCIYKDTDTDLMIAYAWYWHAFIDTWWAICEKKIKRVLQSSWEGYNLVEPSFKHGGYQVVVEC